MAHLGRMIKVHFDDWGQDLLWFVVNLQTEQVLEAGPFQNRLYAGKYVFCPRSLYAGMYLDWSDTPIVEMHHTLNTIKYKVTQIEEL
jgi:hypothetical protein